MSKYQAHQLHEEEENTDRFEQSQTVIPPTHGNGYSTENITPTIKKKENKQSYKESLTFLFFFLILGSFIIVAYLFQPYSGTQTEVAKIEQFKSVTAILLVTNEQKLAMKSIKSLLSKYLFQNFIIISHHKLFESKIRNTYNQQQFQFIVDKSNQLDVMLLDKLIKKVQTDYYFLTTTQWYFGNSIFMNQSLRVLRQYPDVAQLVPNLYKTPIQKIYGFSLLPGLHRIKDYQITKEGYSTFVRGSIFLKQVEQKISQFYLKHNIKTLISSNNYNITKLESQDKINKQEIVNPVPDIGEGQAIIQPTPQQGAPRIIQNKDIQKPQPQPQPQQPQPQPQQLQPQQPQPQPQQNFIPTPQSKQPDTILNRLLNRIESNIRGAQKIQQIQQLKIINNLPICIIVFPSEKHSYQELMNSISNQQYQDLTTIRGDEQQKGLTIEKRNYYYYKIEIEKKCKLNTLIMFVNVPLQNGALKHLNSQMQQYRSYIAYSKTPEFTEVLAFYYRIYELLYLNDFGKTNQPFLQNNDREVQTLGMLQITSRFALLFDKTKIVNIKEPTYFSIFRNSTSNPQRNQYNKIIRLSQDMQMTINVYQNGLNAAQSVRPVFGLTSKNMLQAIDREQQWYLPQGHSIQQLQFEQYSRTYKIGQLQNISKQVHFCVTVLSHNNIQNHRYIKVLKSIVQQKYENYHIVFIDDNSTDNNMNGTIDYLNSIGFPKNKVIYIQNLKRNYATYNIINGAYNYCGVDDVQMLMDGDDEFIGKYAFQVMNSFYQDPQNWVAYSNYKTNFYQFGRSRQLNSEYEHAANGRRSYISIFGAIRSWRVKLLYHIPILYHKMQNGQWLDTVYDDALSHPLAQLSTVRRFKYVPQILYEYNMRYGDNDDSTPTKLKHRAQTYRYVISLNLLTPLTTLEGSTKDKDIDKQLTTDNNIKYKVITP